MAVQLFNKIKRKMTKNMKKHVSLYFPDVMSKYILFGMDFDVTRNGTNLKLKVKSEFSLNMGLINGDKP